MVFRDPYESPMRISSAQLAQGLIELRWDTVPGGFYRIETSTNLTHWSALGNGIEAVHDRTTLSIETTRPAEVFRIRLGRP
jgi:hypothetical protein